MAEKTACGCFLLLRNKKQLISMAAARGRAAWPKKIACGCFLLLRNKKQLISMAPARGLAGWPQKIACGYFLLYLPKKAAVYKEFLTCFPGKCSIRPPHTENNPFPFQPLASSLIKRSSARASFEKGARLSAFRGSPPPPPKAKSAGAFSPRPGALPSFSRSLCAPGGIKGAAALFLWRGVLFWLRAKRSRQPQTLSSARSPNSARLAARPGAPRRPKTLPPASAHGQ